MYRSLGKTVSRAWPLFLGFWIVLLVATWLLAPPWDEVAHDEDFAFLPANAPSRQGEKLFRKAFPDDHLGSTVVLVFRREVGLRDADERFLENVLEQRLRALAEAEGGLAGEGFVDPSSSEPPPSRSLIARIRMPTTPGTGAFLKSNDGKAALVVVELTTEFMSRRNWKTIAAVDGVLADLRSGGKVPEGLEAFVTGSAVLGRDRTLGQRESIRATETWTIVLVVVLLLLINRAPLVAAIPLATVFLAVQVSIHVLALLARAGHITLFEGIQTYITVVAYGAGVDYCLFLAARFEEELSVDGNADRATVDTVAAVGGALAASAATVICGIGMMSFAQFGKFRQAGLAMPLSLVVVLAATLTFSTPLLRMAGRWAFWPRRIGTQGPTTPPGRLENVWRQLAQLLLRRPGTVWLVSVAILVPFALGALARSGQQSYDWIESLPAQSPGQTATKALQDHFPAGLLGPLTVLVVHPQADFNSPDGRRQVERLTGALEARKHELSLADVRSLTRPLGSTAAAARTYQRKDLPAEVINEAIREQANAHFMSDLGERQEIGTRFELVFDLNPFSPRAIERLQELEQSFHQALQEEIPGAEVHFIGNTPGVRDLKSVTEGDRLRIEILVLASVFIILLVVVRSLWLSSYLILSVLLSYYATLGVSLAVFWFLNPAGFSGLDWKVGIFLFTILIAVGQDYNIMLLARVMEEQKRHGEVVGITEALVRTGPIISSCGLIMAGTFASLAAGSLPEMKQLGFALAFGVLLDTFVVRPILVPAFLIAFAGRIKKVYRRDST